MIQERRTCPDCNGSGEQEFESARPCPTPQGPRWRTWRDTCQLCGGEREIAVDLIDMEDLPE